MAPRKAPKIVKQPSSYPSDRYNAVQDRESNTVGINISKARRDAGLTLIDMAERLRYFGVSATSGAISKWETGVNLPSVYQLIAVCKVLDIEEGLSYFMGESAKRLQLNEAGLQKLADYKADLIASGHYKPAPLIHENSIRYVTMPVSVLGASAGTGEFLSEENFTHEQFPENFVPAGADFGMRVWGDSMEPVYHDGQFVWIKRCKQLQPGQVGIFMYDGDGYIKVYGEQEPDESEEEDFTDSYGIVHPQPVLISYNRSYPPRPISPNARFEIVGRVL